MSLFTCVQKPLPEFDEEADLLDVTLDDIAENVSLFLNGFKSLQGAKKVIEKKYEIKKDYSDCWPAEDIKRAFGQTQRMDVKSRTRRYWSHVIILQILKRCMVYAGHEDNTTNETKKSCVTRPGMKEVEAAGGGEQMFGVITSELSGDSGVVSGGQLLASSTDEAPSPAEEKPATDSNNSESKKAALSENEERSCDQHKDVELDDMYDPENKIWEDVFLTDDSDQACGEAEIMKGNSEDRSSQSSAELETLEAARDDKRSSGANRKTSKSALNQTDTASQGRSGKQCSAGSQDMTDDAGAPGGRSKKNISAAAESEAENETICIRIPFSAMFSRESPFSRRVAQQTSPYKLINGSPSETDLRIRKTYSMSLDTETGNAKWVYEILNRQTLVDNCVQPDFGQGYVKGHLAAARNQKWCQEALNDANLFSNIVPQNAELNNGTWKSLEIDCRNIHNDIRNVHVYTGPLYLRRTRRMPRLGGKVIPTHLFKVIIKENVDGTVREPECYVMPNVAPQSADFNVYRVNIEDLQRFSGLTFIERRPSDNMRSYKKTVQLQGESGGGHPRNAEIIVLINS